MSEVLRAALAAASLEGLDKEAQANDALVEETFAKLEEEQEGLPSANEVLAQVKVADNDIEIFDELVRDLSGETVTVESLLQARSAMVTIAKRYGAEDLPAVVSTESFGGDLMAERDSLVTQINEYRDSLEGIVAGALLFGAGIGLMQLGPNSKKLGENIRRMREVAADLKSNNSERIRRVKLTGLSHYLKVGGAVPKDVVNGISRQTAFAWSLVNGVFDIIAKSSKALAENSEKVAG